MVLLAPCLYPPNTLKINMVPSMSEEVHYYLYGSLLEPEHYVDLVEDLRKAEPGDTFYIHINCGGGFVSTESCIINAIRSSSATVVGVAEGEIYSAAALIFFSCDEYMIHEYSTFMLHDVSCGFEGKTTRVKAELDFLRRISEKMHTEICSPYITAAEIKQIMAGHDLWFTSEEILGRIDKHS